MKQEKTLAEAHALHRECKGDIIIHAEADEVYDQKLLREISIEIEVGNCDLKVWRLQISQNFQRVKWYPELVHRVFRKGSVIKEGHTTNRHKDVYTISPELGFLWDCTDIFRDNWIGRIKQQSKLWSEIPQYRAVPIHFGHNIIVENIDEFLNKPHWEWKTTPLNIPDILRPLVGITKYNPSF